MVGGDATTEGAGVAKRSSKAKRRDPNRRLIAPRNPAAFRPELGKDRLPAEQQLVDGWRISPHARIRLARSADIEAIAQLGKLAGAEDLEEEIADGLRRGVIAAALCAGLHGGREPFTQHIAQVGAEIGRSGADPTEMLLHATLVLVAEHSDAGVVGALIAYPPLRVIADLLDTVGKGNPKAQQAVLLSGATMISRIHILAVAEPWRRHRVGAALLDACHRIYAHCGYVITYGQMPPTRGLDVFYRRCGFTLLEPGEGFDAWIVFGIHTKIHPQPDERVFLKSKVPVDGLEGANEF